MDEDATIGFIGLGLMGSAMAGMLLDDGRRLVVCNREPEALDTFAAHGATVAGNPAEVAAQANVVLLCVLDTDAVRDVTLGPGGVAEAGRPGALLVDHSTTLPKPTEAMARELAARCGMRWVDAPVSGGPGFARERRLTIMAGGAEADIDALRLVFAAYASTITRVGDVGAGQAAKVINQAISGVSYVLMAEVLRLAEESGVDAARIPECLAGGHADSTMLHFAYPKMLERAFDSPASLASQMLKDLKNVGSEAERLGLSLPLVRLATERFAAYTAEGGGGSETASIYNLYRKA